MSMYLDINRALKEYVNRHQQKLWLGFYVVANSDVGEGKK